MQVIEQIQQFLGSVPKPFIFIIIILVLIGGFFLWKKFSSKDNETEVEKGVIASNVYAQNVATGLDAEREPLVSATSQEFAKEAQVQDSVKSVVGAVALDEQDGSDSDFEEFD